MANAVSHDQNFKNLILDYPRDALDFFAPSEAPAAGDDVTVTPVRQEQLQQRLGVTTIVVMPGQVATVDRFRNLAIELAA